MHNPRSVPLYGGRYWPALLPLVLALTAVSSHAFQFSNGELKGSFDTTLSFGGLYRLDNPDPAFYGTSNTFDGVPGQQNSVNSDDGNLNYKKGFVSELLKGSHDLELKYHNFGALVRGYWFTDFKANDTLRTPLTDQAKDRVVRGAEWLDMYARAGFSVDTMPVEVRVGRQVLSLGESTFIPNGLNVINAADLTKLRTPGAELKEALLPVNMVKASVGITKTITLEPFWLLEFRRNELEPAGSYFSTNDFATRGGENVFLGFATRPDHGSTLGGIPRDRDRDAGNFNQYGLATRIQAPGLEDTEFGLYYVRYNSRSPVVSARTPSGPVDTALVQSTASTLGTQSLVPAMIAAGIPPTSVPSLLSTLLGAALTGVPSSALPPTIQPFYPSALTIANTAKSVGVLTAARTGRYFTEYPEAIDMLGVSFNTSLGRTGISWQGEIAVKKDVPLQIDDVELLYAALSSLSTSFKNQVTDATFLGQYNREVSGYRRHNVWTAQSTMTKVFGPMLGAQQFTLLGEVGGVWVNLPAKSTLRYDAPGTFTAGDQSEMDAAGFTTATYPQLTATPESAFADRFSWGYQLLGRLEYNNILPNIGMLPSIAFTHDVRGRTPLPLGNFVQDRKSVTVGVEFTYRNAWSLELRYVNFFGAGRYNLVSDRDYVATTIKYSF